MLDLGSPFLCALKKKVTPSTEKVNARYWVFMSVFIGSILTQYSHTLYCCYFLCRYYPMFYLMIFSGKNNSER